MCLVRRQKAGADGTCGNKGMCGARLTFFFVLLESTRLIPVTFIVTRHPEQKGTKK